MTMKDELLPKRSIEISTETLNTEPSILLILNLPFKLDQDTRLLNKLDISKIRGTNNRLKLRLNIIFNRDNKSYSVIIINLLWNT